MTFGGPWLPRPISARWFPLWRGALRATLVHYDYTKLCWCSVHGNQWCTWQPPENPEFASRHPRHPGSANLSIAVHCSLSRCLAKFCTASFLCGFHRENQKSDHVVYPTGYALNEAMHHFQFAAIQPRVFSGHQPIADLSLLLSNVFTFFYHNFNLHTISISLEQPSRCWIPFHVWVEYHAGEPGAPKNFPASFNAWS